MKMYNIGDKVYVLDCADVEDRRRRERDIWVASMDDCQGMIGTVRDVAYEDQVRFNVETENGQLWWYREHWLAPYEEIEIDPIGSVSELFI